MKGIRKMTYGVIYCDISPLISELSFMKYVMAEVFSGKLMELEEDKYTERREKVYTFMKIPREFEKVHVVVVLYVH